MFVLYIRVCVFVLCFLELNILLFIFLLLVGLFIYICLFSFNHLFVPHAVAGVPLVYVEFVSLFRFRALRLFRSNVIFCVCLFFFPPLSLFFVSSPEDSSVSYLMVPKPLDGLSLLRVKGKGLKHKVFHASCEWYGVRPTCCPESSINPNSPSTVFIRREATPMYKCIAT